MNKKLIPAVSESTIINRREIVPLLRKAQKMMESYEKAVGCQSLVLDKSGYSITSPEKKTFAFCWRCGACFSNSANTHQEKDGYFCNVLHRDAVMRAERGGSYIYSCEIGFSYWTSPLYTGDRYAGSLAAGQVLTVSREEAAKNFCSRRKSADREKALEMFSDVSIKTHEEIQAVASLLLVCARKLSKNGGSYVPARQKNRKEEHAANFILNSDAWNTPAVNPSKTRPYPQDERMLLAALRRGDKPAASLLLENLLETIQKTNPTDFDFLRLRSVELAVLLSRVAGIDLTSEAACSRWFRRLQESSSPEELRDNLRLIIGQMGSKIFSFRGIRHASAIRKAERFIWENYARKVSLDEIAAASGLSAPYFSTIFKEEMGENLSSYLNRLRVDKAAGLLTETSLPLKEIAQACGFEDQSWFSKIFKSRMDLSPGKYREQGNQKTIEGLRHDCKK